MLPSWFHSRGIAGQILHCKGTFELLSTYPFAQRGASHLKSGTLNLACEISHFRRIKGLNDAAGWFFNFLDLGIEGRQYTHTG